MAIYLNAEARCTHCGNRAPCELKLFLWGTKAIGEREYEGMAAAVHGLETWFQKDDGMACSPECRDVLAKSGQYSAGQWRPCK
jgi:hypothetical protein